jgi:CRISPR-associated protein Cmr2
MGQLLRGGPDRAGRARHACISELLASFALDRVPRTVEEQEGELIVAGGDDVLALLPAATALTCAQSLAGEFEALPWATEAGLLGPGRTPPTVSAGLAVVHYKEDLRFALGCARRAEKTAKGAGRNAFAITVCRRSGEHSLAICDWPFVKSLTRWASGFQKASDRWAYQLAGELPTLRGLPADAMKAELRRVLGRAEKDTRDIFPAESLVCELEACCRFALAPGRRPKDAGFLARHPTRELQDEELLGRALSNFVTLCQTASFLARGRDE